MKKDISKIMKSIILIGFIGIILSQTSFSQGNWSPIYRQSQDDLLSVFFTSSDKGFIGGDNGYFAFTNDGGTSWIRHQLNTKDSLNEIYFRDNNNGYLLVGKKIFLTNDGGKSWRENVVLNPTDFAGLIPEFLSIRFADKKRGWIVGSVANKYEEVVDSLVLHTIDGGETWQKVITPSNKMELYHLSFNNDLGWIVGDNGLIIKTEDDGATWTIQKSGTDVSLYNVDFRDKKNGIIVGSSGTILRTENGGQSWEKVNSSTTKSLLRVTFINDKTGWIVGSGGTILRTDDKGKSWVKQSSQTEESMYGLFSDKKNNSWVVGKKGLILKYLK